MGKGERLRCKNSGAVERQLGRQLAPYSKERRSFLCSVATAGARLAGSGILSLSAEAQRKPEVRPKRLQRPVVETAGLLPPTKPLPRRPLGKYAAAGGTACTFSKACPMAPQPLVKGASGRRSSPNRGQVFATRCSMAGPVQARILLTSILTEET